MGVKKCGGGDKVSVADVGVDEARRMSAYLLSREFRGPGDTIEAAAYRAEARWGSPATMLLRLRHREVRDMLLSNYMRLRAAYEAACEHQARQLRHELEVAQATRGNAAREILVGAAALVAGPEDEAEKKARLNGGAP